MDDKIEIKNSISCIEMKEIYEKCMKEKKGQFELCFDSFTSMLYCGIKEPQD